MPILIADNLTPEEFSRLKSQEGAVQSPLNTMASGVSSDASAPAERKEGIFDKIAAAVDESIQRPFAALGEMIGHAPKKTMALSAVVCLAMMSGLSQIKAESRADKLWFPSGTATTRAQKRYLEDFPREGAVSFIIAESKTKGQMLSKASLTDLLSLHDELAALVSKPPGSSDQGDTLADLCVPGYSGATALPCYLTTVLAPWQFDLTTLAAEASDASALATLNNYYSSDTLEDILGGEAWSDPAETTVASADAVWSVDRFLVAASSLSRYFIIIGRG